MLATTQLGKPQCFGWLGRIRTPNPNNSLCVRAFKLVANLKNKMGKPINKMPKKDRLQKIRENKKIRYILFLAYIGVIIAVFVNLADVQLFPFNYMNTAHFKINSPTDYFFLQTYPPSIDGIEFGDANQTIYFQVHIHCDKMITENSLVTIKAGASAGAIYMQNISTISVGFFGADYSPEERTVFKIPSGEEFELWTGFAGVRLSRGVEPEFLVLFQPEGGVSYGGETRTVFWSTAGDKPITLVLSWNNYEQTFSYTYEFSTVHVYAYADVRATQIHSAEVIGFFGALLFGVFEVYPSLAVNKKSR